ncbi:hypothetical protein EGW08_021409 [Elysia chlorotica]|uniref:Alpha/beta hydrolase fold-5 domain-containing protein n=1 Tax=Elysia chlorotica TaxID=188477 RepID=A0A3S0Z4Z8_ELYCH|nr:hypothetical protein EGW08_021409 [Elysia chlorotica]
MLSVNMKTFFGIVAIFIATVTLTGGDHVLMSPFVGEEEGQKEVAFIIVPEKGLTADDYQMLGIILQDVCPLRLWIAILDPPKNVTLTLDNLPVLLYEVVDKLNDNGMGPRADLFLAAHGQAGHVVSVYTEAVPGTVRGLVLLGTSLHTGTSLASFPVGVMTVVGELDGLTRVTRIASTVQALEEAATSDPDLIVRHPIVLVDGSNHGIFVGDGLPSPLYEFDIDPEVDQFEVLQEAVDMISLFITNMAQAPEDAQIRAKEMFTMSFEHAKSVTEPIRSLRNLTQGAMKSYWVKMAQKWLSGLEGKESSLLEVDSFVTTSEILPLPPTLGVEDGINYVITFSDVTYPGRVDTAQSDNIVTAQTAPLEIAARMIGPERIHKILINTTIARNYTCRDLNYASFQTAYHTASKKAQTRFDQVNRYVRFLPDIVMDSEIEWEHTPLKVEVVGHELHVTGISYKTINDENLSPYAGLYFCKLLPPERAMEWIYVDYIRRNAIPP